MSAPAEDDPSTRTRGASARVGSRAPRLSDQIASALQHSRELALVCADLEGTITVLNEGAADLLGYSPQEVVGRATPAILDGLDPTTRTGVLAAFLACSLDGVENTHEMVVTRKDGARVPVSLALTSMRDDRGEVHGSMAILRDLSEELIHRKAERRSQAIVKAMSDGIIVHGPDGSIVTCNDAATRILGLPREQLLGRTPVDPRWRATRADGSPFPGDEHPASVTLRTGRAQTDVLMSVHRPDGSRVWISASVEPLVDPGTGKPDGVVSCFRDVSVMRRAQETARAPVRARARRHAGRRA